MSSTTDEAFTLYPRSADEYCRTFDLTCRIPVPTIQAARDEGRIVEVQPDDGASRACRTVISRIAEVLSSAEADASLATRICIPSLGSYEWGDLSPQVRQPTFASAYPSESVYAQDICLFIHLLRAELRRHPRACAAVSLSPHLCSESFGGPGWVQKLGWLSDGSITLAAFSGTSLY